MTSWPTKKLGEVCEIISPGIKEFEGSKKYIATADVDFDKILDFTEITYKNRPSRANMEVKENDVLVARMAETKKFLMADKNFQDNYIFSTGFAVLRVKDELIPRYLFYFLTTKDFNLQKDKLAVGATQKAINNPALKKIKIPVPSLSIQQKIVERLDAIKKAQELNEKQIESAEELFQSLLHRELDPKGKNWEMKSLGELCNIYQPKTITSTEILKSGPYKVYGANGVIGYYNKYNHEDSEVLVTCRGATCGTINLSEPKCWITGNAMVVHPKVDNLSKIFLYYTLKNSNLSGAITGAAQPQITRASLSPLKIPLPPLETQQKIVEKLSAVQEYKKKLLDQKQKLQELFESVLNKSFKSQL